MAEVECVRCHQKRQAIEGTPYGGKIGEELKAKVCDVCWQEWLKEMSIKIINEYRLNLGEASARQFLSTQMKIFFGLQPPPPEGGIKITDIPPKAPE